MECVTVENIGTGQVHRVVATGRCQRDVSRKGPFAMAVRSVAGADLAACGYRGKLEPPADAEERCTRGESLLHEGNLAAGAVRHILDIGHRPGKQDAVIVSERSLWSLCPVRGKVNFSMEVGPDAMKHPVAKSTR